eukprot:TRINITY_DN34434_c0_g1_i1.p1 TRINITY_DN34434_c0_g1~~TRINITY_DN34434_c0_g1_i1.p1  ORF type:complete len:508 (-),score=51.52 TRINITY_DN34434_c0_g1_i1:8-1531(-)
MPAFPVGTVVELHGLQKAPELNGRQGIVTRDPNSDGRYGVWLFCLPPIGEKALKAVNMRATESDVQQRERIDSTVELWQHLVNGIISRGKQLGVEVEIGGRRSTAADEPRLTPVEAASAKNAALLGAEGLSRMLLCGLDFCKGIREGGNADLYSDWYLDGMTRSDSSLVVLDALAIKVLDTLAIFGNSGDTLCDVDPLLKKMPGFLMVSAALDDYFQMEDSLTSGYNDFCSFGISKQQRIRSHVFGGESNRRRGPGSLKSKLALQRHRTTTAPDDMCFPTFHTDSPDDPDVVFPFHHLHPKFRDWEGLHQLCEPRTLHLRFNGDRRSIVPGWRTYPEKERPIGPEEADLLVPDGERWYAVLLGTPIPHEPKGTGALCFQLLPDISVTNIQDEANVEISHVALMVEGDEIASPPWKTSINASKMLRSTDDLKLWVPDLLPFMAKEEHSLSWQHHDCAVAKCSLKTASKLCGEDGQLDKDKIEQFMQMMAIMMEKGKGKGKRKDSGKGY